MHGDLAARNILLADDGIVKSRRFWLGSPIVQGLRLQETRKGKHTIIYPR